MPSFSINPARDSDFAFLQAMLYEAAFWRPDVGGASRPTLDEALALPDIARYIAGWGRHGDRALVAFFGDKPLGAAWFRIFPGHDPGYGFVDDDTPEATIGVLASQRGRGVGQALMAALLPQASLDGFRQVSLSVEPDNPAVRLYERLGFERSGREGGALTMVAHTGR